MLNLYKKFRIIFRKNIITEVELDYLQSGRVVANIRVDLKRVPALLDLVELLRHTKLRCHLTRHLKRCYTMSKNA